MIKELYRSYIDPQGPQPLYRAFDEGVVHAIQGLAFSASAKALDVYDHCGLLSDETKISQQVYWGLGSSAISATSPFLLEQESTLSLLENLSRDVLIQASSVMDSIQPVSHSWESALSIVRPYEYEPENLLYSGRFFDDAICSVDDNLESYLCVFDSSREVPYINSPPELFVQSFKKWDENERPAWDHLASIVGEDYLYSVFSPVVIAREFTQYIKRYTVRVFAQVWIARLGLQSSISIDVCVRMTMELLSPRPGPESEDLFLLFEGFHSNSRAQSYAAFVRTGFNDGKTTHGYEVPI